MLRRGGAQVSYITLRLRTRYGFLRLVNEGFNRDLISVHQATVSEFNFSRMADAKNHHVRNADAQFVDKLSQHVFFTFQLSDPVVIG